MNLRIVAVVVTHNRRALLSRCLDYLKQQERQLDGIFVVNNASTDGTEELLESVGVNFVTQENVGSAGGWHCGIQYAIDHGYDAVWLMDDDGFPDVGALLSLESSLVPGVACASSVVLCEDRPTHFVFPFPILDGAGLPTIRVWRHKLRTLTELRTLAPGGTYPFAHFFNGALVSLTAALEVGNVNREFFIFGDEVDYFFRLRKAGKVISVLDAVHFHPDVSKRPYNPLKVYYYLKNTIVLNSRYFNAVWIRNIMAVFIVLGRTAKRNDLRTAFSYLFGTNAPGFYSAIVRGLRGKVGKDFNG